MDQIKKHLYFVCPTDYLEAVINDAFKDENYYMTSLGNSITLDANKIDEINALVTTKDISEITFVLSDNNSIVVDALENQSFAKICRLGNFYHDIIKQKKRTVVLWQAQDHRMSILSYYLSTKVYALMSQLNRCSEDRLKINAKIYSRQKSVFLEVFSDLIYNRRFILN